MKKTDLQNDLQRYLLYMLQHEKTHAHPLRKSIEEILMLFLMKSDELHELSLKIFSEGSFQQQYLNKKIQENYQEFATYFADFKVQINPSMGMEKHLYIAILIDLENIPGLVEAASGMHLDAAEDLVEIALNNHREFRKRTILEKLWTTRREIARHSTNLEIANTIQLIFSRWISTSLSGANLTQFTLTKESLINKVIKKPHIYKDIFDDYGIHLLIETDHESPKITFQATEHSLLLNEDFDDSLALEKLYSKQHIKFATMSWVFGGMYRNTKEPVYRALTVLFVDWCKSATSSSVEITSTHEMYDLIHKQKENLAKKLKQFNLDLFYQEKLLSTDKKYFVQSVRESP